MTAGDRGILHNLLYYHKKAVSISTSDSGGLIDVYNPFGKEAVSVQSNKMNQGAVYVFDVNGKVTDTLPKK